MNIDRALARSVWDGDKDRNIVALTFDDGPKPETCTPILDALDRFGDKATFFVIGMEAEINPDLIKRIVDSGHDIGNHTYSHIPASEKSVKDYLEDIKRCSQVIYDITGTVPRYFRPPGGGMNEGISKGLKKMGLRAVFWSVNADDYTEVSSKFALPNDYQADADRLVKRVLDKVRPGDIILMHSSSEQTALALPAILEGLNEKGYRTVTISEILEDNI